MCQEQESLSILKDIALPIATVAISIVAVIFTWRALYIQKKHNITSIKPIGKIRIGDYESDIHISIDNNGIGPLLLQKVYLNDTEIKPDGTLVECIPEDKRNNIIWNNFSGNYINRVIPAGQNLVLIRWTPESDSEKNDIELAETRHNLRITFKDWNIKIEYTNIYESQTFVDELKLLWFGRNEE